MTVVNAIDYSGLWSQRQAAAVIAVLNIEGRQRGIHYQALDVTTFNNSERRFIIVAHCIHHDCPIEVNSVCPMCLVENGE